ncbi:hypothetical protein FGB62_259g015 [Gracilaria domingensis]|nr:hypothetical protein FGB62_259g015 [Gracilaria domingensis]
MPPAALGGDQDASSSSDDGFEVKAVTTADGVRLPKPPSPAARHDSIRALTPYDDASSSSSSAVQSSPASRPVKKRVRFAEPASPRKRARTSSPGAQIAEGERADEEAVLMAELARFEARVEAIDRDQEAVTQDLLDAGDYYEQLAQRQLEQRVASLRGRLREKSDVESAAAEQQLTNMHVEQRRRDGGELSDDEIEIKCVLREHKV